ncbi:M17 family peptidase N-terminal domain-containing protein, partial [Cylindrospermopsis raciborskii]|uniref:M17 family peptidase N-terminal domain-containing protein n=1 Tax=Cylindrospermopsis raciborskii TaxID=77022 RepID=UPI0038D0207E
MITRTSDTELLNWTGDTLGIGLFEDAVELKDDLATLNQKYGGVFSEVIAEEEFTGKANTTVVIRVGANSPIRKVIFIGLGKVDTLKLETLRIAAATLARTAKKQKTKTLAISFPVYNNQPAATAQAITEGAQLALYQDIRFKSEPEDKNP